MRVFSDLEYFFLNTVNWTDIIKRYLKGSCYKIFNFSFFHESFYPGHTLIILTSFWVFSPTHLRKYLLLNVHPPVSFTPAAMLLPDKKNQSVNVNCLPEVFKQHKLSVLTFIGVVCIVGASWVTNIFVNFRCPLMLNTIIFFFLSFLITSAWMADTCHGGVPFNSADGANHLMDTSTGVSVLSCPTLSTLHFAPVVCTTIHSLNVRMLNVKILEGRKRHLLLAV